MKLALIASALASVALALGPSEAGAQAKEVKFGCYAPLTGQLAIFGNDVIVLTVAAYLALHHRSLLMTSIPRSDGPVRGAPRPGTLRAPRTQR